MSMSDLERAVEMISQMRDADFIGPKSETLIIAAEQRLGLAFPPSYRKFLACLGCGDVIGCEFYGLIGEDFDNSGVPDAIWITLRNRKSAGLFDSFILVSDTGYGNYYAIDVSKKTPEGDSPVVEWQPLDSPEVRRPIAEDFGAFLLEMVQWSQRDRGS